MSTPTSAITTLIGTSQGQVFVSILFGLGLAALFRRVCHGGGDQCVVVKSPPEGDIEKYYYKIDDECFKYNKVPTSCEKR